MLLGWPCTSLLWPRLRLALRFKFLQLVVLLLRLLLLLLLYPLLLQWLWMSLLWPGLKGLAVWLLASFDMFFFVTGSSKPELFGTEETLLLAPPVSPSPLFFVLYNICILTSGFFFSFQLIIWTGVFSKTEKYWWRKLQENYKYRLTICCVTLSISRIKKICVSNFFFWTTWRSIPRIISHVECVFLNIIIEILLHWLNSSFFT